MRRRTRLADTRAVQVLAAHAERLAITTWYFDREEHAKAKARGAAAEQTDSQESEAIEHVRSDPKPGRLLPLS